MKTQKDLVSQSAIYSLYHCPLPGPQENGISKDPSWLSVPSKEDFVVNVNAEWT